MATSFTHHHPTMAGANSSSFSFLRPTITITTQNKLLLFARMATPSKPTKLTKRRNTLRQKIFKITTKPYDDPRTPEIPLQELLLPQNDAVSEENGKAEEFRSSEVVNASVGEFSGRSLVRYGMYLIGVFVFQTVLAVWVLGTANSEKEDGELGSLDSKGKVLLNGNEKILRSNVGLGEKIEEIRALASKARKTEKNKDESLNSRTKIGIEKEIEKRLLTLQKGLNSTREKLPRSYVNYLSNYWKDEDGEMKKKKIISLDVGKGNESLMFKKKLKFRSPSTEAKEGPKGFGDFEKRKVLRGKKNGLGGRDKMVEVSEEEREEVQKEMDLEEGDGKRLVVQKSRVLQGDGKNLDKGMRRENGGEEGSRTRKSRNGVIQGSRPGRSSVEVANLTTSRELGMENDQNFENENFETVEESNEHPVLSINGSSRLKEAEEKPASNKVAKKHSNVETNMWWLNLPYVLVVHMQRGSAPEGPGGLFTLKLSTEAHDENELSYTVAFEDRGDANNFCYLLESFFEDLGDVRADTVPLSVKELHAAVESDKWKVVVVKKGQLQLYAGQPFADVEMALHALIKETQSAR